MAWNDYNLHLNTPKLVKNTLIAEKSWTASNKFFLRYDIITTWYRQLLNGNVSNSSTRGKYLRSLKSKDQRSSRQRANNVLDHYNYS